MKISTGSPQPGPLVLCTLKVQEVTTWGYGAWFVSLSVCLSACLYLSALLNVASRAMTRVTKDTRLLSKVKSHFF